MMKKSIWKTIKRRPLTQVLLAVVFLTSGFFIVLIQLALYILLRPWNARLYRKINPYLTFSLHGQITFLIDYWTRSSSRLFVDPDVLKKYVGKEHAFLICNHGLELEGFLLWTCSEHLGMLGSIRGMIKKNLCYAPILGWAWYLQEQVFLERNWEKDKHNLAVQLKNLTACPDPVWLTIFPEGTRFTQAKHEISMQTAREKGLPELEHLLLPRTKGFVAGLAHLREKFPAIYDITVVVDQECQQNASFYGLLNVQDLSYKIALRRFSTSEMPQDEKEVADWLHKRFQEKDKLLDNMMLRGEFNPPMESSCSKEMKQEFETYEYIKIPKRVYPLMNVGGWAVLILGMLFYFSWTTFMAGSYFQMGLLFGVLFTASFGLEKAIDLSRVSKASSYGGTGISK